MTNGAGTESRGAQGVFRDNSTGAEQTLFLGTSGRCLVGRNSRGEEVIRIPVRELSVFRRQEEGGVVVMLSGRAPGRSVGVSPGTFSVLERKLFPRGAWRSSLLWCVVSLAAAVIAGVSLKAASPGSLARMIPAQAREQLGQLLLPSESASCRSEDGDRALARMVDRIGADYSGDTSLTVRVVRDPEINAFAGPGGVIVLNRGLFSDKASPEEVAMVLAHEMAHAELLHPTAGLIRHLGVSGLGMILASVTGVGDFIGGIAVALSRLRYSREDEAEADARALEMLAYSGVDPGGGIDFFRRVSGISDPDEEASFQQSVILYFSTHPSVRERIRKIRDHIARNQGKVYEPVLSPQEWEALKAICDKP